MKKIFKILALTAALMIVFSGCEKKKDNGKKEDEKPEVKQEQKIDENDGKENKNSDNEKDTEKDKKEASENSENTAENKNEKTDSGMFLGMSDSNFLVIFSATDKKDVYFKIDPSLNFENSDIEIGTAVNYRYTVSETDEKTITFIEAKE